MSVVSLWSPGWSAGTPPADLATRLLASVPRVVQAPGRLWADGRGLDPRILSGSILDLLEDANRPLVDASSAGAARPAGDPPSADTPGSTIFAGIAATPIAAEVAATRGAHPPPDGAPKIVSRTTELHPEQIRSVTARVNRAGHPPLVVVPPGTDAAFLAPFSIDVLEPAPDLLRLLDGIGVSTCGQLAALARESIEVRLGPEAVPLWRRARGDDDRRIFTTLPRELPHASMEWEDYALRDGERMQFIVNALAGRLCTTLDERGEGARQITLVISLAGGETHEQSLRFARPTASRRAWMRQLRLVLDRLSLPDGVTGLLLRADTVAGMHAPQGDLFDRGFASAAATEQTLGDIADDQGEVFLAPESSSHPLLEARARWTAREPSALAETHALHAPGARTAIAPRLTLQLLPEPRTIGVEASVRRDHEVPVRYRDGWSWYELVEAAGPDRVSGAQWETRYAREYFRCVRGDGLLVWIFRDARPESGEWYLHGWWD